MDPQSLLRFPGAATLTRMETSRPHMTARGSKDELISALQDSAIGWDRLANDKLRDQCLSAIDQLSGGADSAIVGHTRYEVA